MKNYGIQHFGKPIEAEEKTLIILGAARGGTSACIGILSKLNVFTGSKSFHPIYEDATLSQSIEERNYTKAKLTIEEYNRQHKVWAYKRPSLIDHLPQIHPLFRNPIYVVIFRDPHTIASRFSKSFDKKLWDQIYFKYNAICEFISSEQKTGICLSYEKLINNSALFVNTLCELLKSDAVTEKHKLDATNFINPEAADYEKASKQGLRFLGHLDSVNTELASGWACKIGSDKAVVVEFFKNDIKLGEVQANEVRPDVKASGLHSSAYCGFSWSVPPSCNLKPGDTVSAIIQEYRHELNDSPKRCEMR